MSKMLLKVSELAQILNLSQRTIHRLNCTGKLPSPIKISGSIRWRQSDIDLWLDLDCPDRGTFDMRKAS